MTTIETVLPEGLAGTARLSDLSNDDLPDAALVSTQLAATLLGTSEIALTKQRYRKRGPAVVLLPRRRVRYRVSDLRAWLAEHPRANQRKGARDAA